MFKYVYIDESGDLGEHGSNYIVLAALIIDNPQELGRIIKNMRRNKFKKELKKAFEIKANKSSENVKIHMLKKLNAIKNTKVLYVILEKKKVISDYLKNNKDKLYNYIAGKLAKQLIMDDVHIEIRIDRRQGKQLLQQDFNNYFTKCLKDKSHPSKIIIQHSYSHNFAGLQFADMLAWACFQKFEHKDSGYIDILKIEQEVYHVW
ncbi:DUF3800 domain-containing protein [Candidatus Pacearchaeota archaeon]|nr:DUF3800 domain-containing protein [Candidatus Pacearchaeota archaeon]